MDQIRKRSVGKCCYRFELAILLSVNEEQKSGRIFDLAILRRLYAFVKPYQTRFYLLIGIIMLAACLAPLTPLLIRYTIDNVIAMGDYQKLTQMLVI